MIDEPMDYFIKLSKTRRKRDLNCKTLFIVLFCLVALLSGLGVIQIKPKLRLSIRVWFSNLRPADIVYRTATKIPKPPAGKAWLEENYLCDRKVADIRELSDPFFSIFRLEGSPEVTLGDAIHVKVILYNAFRQRKKTGGDLVRVWMRELSKNASSNGKVIDHKDGSYTAILTAFWVGTPEIVAAIIAPREVTAFAMKRRYILPNILTNIAIFEHPKDTFVEETPCNYDPQVPGYDVICNFTENNSGIPWYCGKPKSDRLTCSDWTKIALKHLWIEGIEQTRLSPLELEMLSLKKKTMVFSNTIQISVNSGEQPERVVAKRFCNKTSPSDTWKIESPTGYLYNGKWNNKYCRREPYFTDTYERCMKNMHIIVLGDSTLRQVYNSMKDIIPGVFNQTVIYKSGEHRPFTFKNFESNVTLTYLLPQLPFCSKRTPWQYFKSFGSQIKNYEFKQKTVVILNLFAHLLNFHSHVYIEHLQRMRTEISDFLSVYPNVTIIIKGPHAYSFARNSDIVLWMPDIYASAYLEYLYEIFRGLHDRVILLDALDITVSTEQWDIHADEYIIKELALNIIGYIC